MTERTNRPENEPLTQNPEGAVEEKGSHIREIEEAFETAPRGLAESDLYIRDLQGQLARWKRGAEESNQATQDLERAMGNLKDRLAGETSRAEKAQAEVERLSRRLMVTERALKRQSEELGLIQNSLAGQFVHHVWAWNMRWFPFGSSRRKIYSRAARGIARLFLGLRVRPAASREPTTTEPLSKPSPSQEKPAVIMHCDEPRDGEGCAGVITIRGWAVAKEGIQKIRIRVDGKEVGEAQYGQEKPDIGLFYPYFVDSYLCGFSYLWDSTQVSEGPHVIGIVAEGRNGKRGTLSVPIVVDQKFKDAEFEQWISQFEPSAVQLKKMTQEALSFPYRPLVSIVVPIFRTPIKFLRASIESVRNQIYTNWELCLADDGWKNPELAQLVQEYSGLDSRIRYTEVAENQGVSAATNAALALATGEFVGFLAGDDELSPDALYWVVKLLQEHRDAGVIYSDEDKLNSSGNRSDPFFKPDWSPDMLLSNNYVRHFLAVRRGLLREVGGFRSEYDGSQDYDLVLRLWERTNRIHHIPRILYHWRIAETSTGSSHDLKSKAHVAAERAVTDYLKRNSIRGRVEEGCVPGQWVVRYEILDNPKVSVIMPTGGKMELLHPCLESVFTKTDYANYEILLVDNSKDSEVAQYAEGLLKQGRPVQHLDYRGKKFNFSTMNNVAVPRVSGPMLLFLNDDTTVVNREWLGALVEQGQRPGVGAVGAKLLFPSGTIQHAGVIMGIGKNSGHAFKGIPGDSKYYFCFAQTVRNCSAVTAACMLTRKALFEEIGGFDEQNLGVGWQDVDFCLRVSKAGYYLVYTPLAVLVHHESVTKQKVGNMREVVYMQTMWADVIANDPFYNPNLTRRSTDYSLRWE